MEVTSAMQGCRIHSMFNPSLLEQSLAILGESLADRDAAFEIVAVGGGSLLLLRLISRPTADLDVVALIEHGQYVKPGILPAELADAAHATARVIGIREDWINTGPAALLDFGLPAGFANRTVKRRFGGLVVHLAGRRDQVFLKLYAAVDQGPNSKHFQDLIALDSSREELLDAARWTITHDPSPGFRAELVKALAALGVGDGDRYL
jgi:hypothetical protein